MRKDSKLYLFLSRWKHRLDYGFNVFKTIYVNFTFLPFKQAIRFPVLIYGKVKVYAHSGKIIIEDRIRPGMIHLGMNTDKFSASKGSALINITGKLIFKGPALFSSDYTLHIVGECSIGEYSFMGNGVKIYCVKKIFMGRCCRITVECQVFDTNFHYMRNIKTGRVDRRDESVVIGDYCWVGNRTTIAKGTRLPDFSLVSGYSLVNKNFTESNVKYPFFAGIPAKIVSSGRVRIFDRSEEEKIDQFFDNNPGESFYMGDPGEINEDKGIIQFFSWL